MSPNSHSTDIRTVLIDVLKACILGVISTWADQLLNKHFAEVDSIVPDYTVSLPAFHAASCLLPSKKVIITLGIVYRQDR